MQQDENQEDDKIAIPLLVLGSRGEEYVMKALNTKDQISPYIWKHKKPRIEKAILKMEELLEENWQEGECIWNCFQVEKTVHSTRIVTRC